MDWTSFGLSRDPFERCPELDDACLPNAMAAQLSELLSGLRSPQGVSVLVGEAGSGKSMAAEAFSRRLRGAADVALVSRPTSSALSIAREVLSQLDPGEHDFRADDDWPLQLRERARRCGATGRATVVLIDNAHRLSPQSLEDLAGLLGRGPQAPYAEDAEDAEDVDEDESVRLHLVLFGRPALTEKMDAGASRALDAHLLQICHLEPLGVRQSVRYLERRLAICGGDLAQLFTADAIDEIVQSAGGRLLDLEEVACEALRRATGRGSGRASVEDVVATSRRAEDVRAGGGDQQALHFADDTEADAADADQAWDLEAGPASRAAADRGPVATDEDDEEGSDVEWGDDEVRDETEWLADEAGELEDDEAGDEDSADLDWEASPYVLEEDEAEADLSREEDHPRRAGLRSYDLAGLEEDFEDDLQDDEEVLEEEGPSPMAHRLVGPAVISIAACAVLMWAANNVPAPEEETSHGRDATIFAEKLTSEPSEIMRLARTAEAADADAHVVAWRAEPPRPARPARDSRDGAVDAGQAVASRDVPTGARKQAARRPDDDQLGGRTSTPTAEAPVVARAVPEARPRPAEARPAVVGKATAARPVAAAPRPAVASRPAVAPAPTGRIGTGPVFTVQLGAFKTRRNAEVLAQKLRGKSAQILEGNGLYRVVSGSFSSRTEALAHEAALKRDGYSTFVRTATF